MQGEPQRDRPVFSYVRHESWATTVWASCGTRGAPADDGAPSRQETRAGGLVVMSPTDTRWGCDPPSECHSKRGTVMTFVTAGSVPGGLSSGGCPATATIVASLSRSRVRHAWRRAPWGHHWSLCAKSFMRASTLIGHTGESPASPPSCAHASEVRLEPRAHDAALANSPAGTCCVMQPSPPPPKAESSEGRPTGSRPTSSPSCA